MGAIREIFSDHTGKLSSIRVMCMLSLLAAIGLAFTGHDNSVLIFTGCAFGSKITQKHVELNGNKVDTDVTPDS